SVLIKGGQIVEAADVEVVDVDLRHGAPPGSANHFRAPRRLHVDTNFFDFHHALCGQQPFRSETVRTPGRAVHADPRHSTSRPEDWPAARPRSHPTKPRPRRSRLS